MSAMGEAMNRVVPNLVRLARAPGRVLLVGAAVPVAAFAVLAVVLGIESESWTGWLPLTGALVLAVPVAVLAWRRERLQRTTASLDRTTTVLGAQDLVVGQPGVDPRRARMEAEMATLSEAYAEGQVRTARWLPRVEAAQRSLLRAAGGPVSAPYLRDDLRVTLVALVGTVAAIPLGSLGAILTAFALLLR